jgi:hypothetical protein
MSTRFSAAVTLVLLSAPAVAQLPDLEIQEVLIDPVGPNAGAQRIELANRGSQPIDLDGIYLVSSVNQLALPSHVLPVGGVVVLHLGASGSAGPADIYLPLAGALALSDTVALFQTSAVTNPNELIDFVSFGGGTVGIAVATLAAQWPSAQDSVALPAVEGATIAHYGQYVLGSRDASSAWFVDNTPTIGSSNDAGAFFGISIGCFGPLFPPAFRVDDLDNRPWIGRTWQLEMLMLSSSQSVVWLALGSPMPSISLGSLGLNSCFSDVAPFAISAHQMPPFTGLIPVAVPDVAALVGADFRLQALATGFPALNPIGMMATRTMLVVVGSR